MQKFVKILKLGNIGLDAAKDYGYEGLGEYQQDRTLRGKYIFTEETKRQPAGFTVVKVEVLLKGGRQVTGGWLTESGFAIQDPNGDTWLYPKAE